MRLIDLFCGAGGAAVGYAQVGFEVVGLDHEYHPDFPFEHQVGDAMDVLAEMVRDGGLFDGLPVDAIHASPPCQAYSTMTPDREKHPRLVEPVRDLLKRLKVTYVIENVPAAPLIDPIKLCGSMFPNEALRVRRHRMFELNFPVLQPRCAHKAQGAVVGVYGKGPDAVPYTRPDGSSRGVKASSLEDGQSAMGIDWMRWDDLKESIPPAYTRWIGRHMIEAMEAAA